jgi:hypothetical protein
MRNAQKLLLFENTETDTNGRNHCKKIKEKEESKKLADTREHDKYTNNNHIQKSNSLPLSLSRTVSLSLGYW